MRTLIREAPKRSLSATSARKAMIWARTSPSSSTAAVSLCAGIVLTHILGMRLKATFALCAMKSARTVVRRKGTKTEISSRSWKSSYTSIKIAQISLEVTWSKLTAREP